MRATNFLTVDNESLILFRGKKELKDQTELRQNSFYLVGTWLVWVA